ncbi:DUF6415 family natural product biosynthesis protein [Streptomyces sp. URMC 125]|uniref:DUF6415 family natural product biosynthesis protein n=1 Tax=Streptomyces sp. URMC 125 TaxID=3423419 RepID=UPI003F1C140C
MQTCASVPSDPIDWDAIARSVTQARSTGSMLPRHDVLAELETELREYIARLLPAVEQQVAGMPRSAEREALRARVEYVRHRVGQYLSTGLEAARAQVAALGRECAWLVEQHPAAGGGRRAEHSRVFTVGSDVRPHETGAPR